MPFRCGSLSQVSDGVRLSRAVRSTPRRKRRQGSTSSLNKLSRKPREREAFRSITTGGDDDDPLSLVGTEFLVREYPLTVLERRNDFRDNSFDLDQPQHGYSPRRSDEDWIHHLQRTALQYNDCSRNDEGTVSRQQKRGFGRIRNMMSSSSSISNNTPRNIHNKNSIHGKELQRKILRKIHGRSRTSAAPLCPNCSGKLTYLYMSTNGKIYDIYDGNESTKEKLRSLLPPLCEKCRTHLLFENSKCNDLMMENFNEWLESGLNEDSDSTESNDEAQGGIYNYNDPRNAKLIVANSASSCESSNRDARMAIETCSGSGEMKMDGPTPRLGNLGDNSQFGFNDNGMRSLEDSPKFSDLSSLTDGHKVYQRKEGLYFERMKHCGNEQQQPSMESMPEEDRQDADLVENASNSDHAGRRDGLSPDYYSSDEDPFLDIPKDEDDCDETPPEPENNTSRSSCDMSKKCSDACQEGGDLSEQMCEDQLKFISLLRVDSSHLPKAQNMVSDSSESIKLIHTESEERAILEHYSMKKKVATVQIAKDLIRGHEVTSSECVRCKMPMTKKEGGALQCVTCPAITKKAKRIAKQKRKEIESIKCLEQHDASSAEEEIKEGVVEVGKLEEGEPNDETVESSNYVVIREEITENTDDNITSGKGEIDESEFSLTSDLNIFAVVQRDGSKNANSFNKDSVSLANLEDMRNVNAMEEGLLVCNSLESGPLQFLGDCSDGINYGSYSESARDSNTNEQSAHGLSWPPKPSSSSSSIYLNPNSGRTAEESVSFNQSDYWTRHSSSQCNTTWHTSQPSAAVSSNSAIPSTHSYRPSIKSQQSAIEYSLSLYKKGTIGKSSSERETGDQHCHNLSSKHQASSSETFHYQGSSELSAIPRPHSCSFHSSDMTIQQYEASSAKERDCQLQHTSHSNTPFHKVSQLLQSSDSSSTQFVHNLPAGEIIHHCASYPNGTMEVDERTHGSHINLYQGSMAQVAPVVSEIRQSHVSSPGSKMTHSQCQQLYHCQSNQLQGLPSDMSCTSSTQCPRNLPSSEMIHRHCQSILSSEGSVQPNPSHSSHQGSLPTNPQPSCGLPLSSDVEYHQQSNATDLCQQSPRSNSKNCERTASNVSYFQDSCASSTRCPNNLPCSEMIYQQCQSNGPTGEQVCQSHTGQYQGSTSEISENKLHPSLLPCPNPRSARGYSPHQVDRFNGNSNQYPESISEVSSSACYEASPTLFTRELPPSEVIQECHQSATTGSSQAYAHLDHSNHFQKPMSKASSQQPKTQQSPNIESIHCKPLHSHHGKQLQKSSSELSCDSPTQCPRNLPSNEMIHCPTQPNVSKETGEQFPLNHSNLSEDYSSEVSSMQMKLPVPTHQNAVTEADSCDSKHNRKSPSDMSDDKVSSASCEASSTRCPRNIPSSEMIWHNGSHKCSSEATNVIHAQHTESPLKDTTRPADLDGISKASFDEGQREDCHPLTASQTSNKCEHIILGEKLRDQKLDSIHNLEDICGISNEPLREKHCHQLALEESAISNSDKYLHPKRGIKDGEVPESQKNDERIESFDTYTHGKIATPEKLGEVSPGVIHTQVPPTSSWCHHFDQNHICEDQQQGEECLGPRKSVTGIFTFEDQENDNREEGDRSIIASGDSVDENKTQSFSHYEKVGCNSGYFLPNCGLAIHGERIQALAGGDPNNVSAASFWHAENQGPTDGAYEYRNVPAMTTTMQGLVSTEHGENKTSNNDVFQHYAKVASYNCQPGSAGSKTKDSEEAPLPNPETIECPKQKPTQVLEEENLGEKIAQLAASLQQVAGQLPRKDNHQHMVKAQSEVQNEPPTHESVRLLDENQYQRLTPCSKSSSINASNIKKTQPNEAKGEKMSDSKHGKICHTKSHEKRSRTFETPPKKGYDYSTQQIMKYQTPHRLHASAWLGDKDPSLHTDEQKSARNSSLRGENTQPVKVSESNVSASNASTLYQNSAFLNRGICFRPRLRPSPIKREDGSCYQYNLARPRGINCEETSLVRPACSLSTDRPLSDNSFGISISPITIRRRDKQFDILHGHDGDETTSSNEENINSLFFLESSPCSSPKKILADPPGRKVKSKDSWLRDPPDDFHPGGCCGPSSHSPIDLPGKGDKSHDAKETATRTSQEMLAYDGARDPPPSNVTPEPRGGACNDNSFPPAKLSDVPPPRNTVITMPTRQIEPCTTTLFSDKIPRAADAVATPIGKTKKGVSEPPPSSVTPKIRGGRRRAEISKLPLGDTVVASPRNKEKKRLANDVTNGCSTAAPPHDPQHSSQISQEESQLNAPSWEIDEVGVPLQTANSFGESSLGQLFKQIDEIEDDFNTIVASLPGSEGQTGSEGMTIASSLKSTASDDREPLPGSSTRHSLVEITFDTAGSFESNVSGDSMVTDVVQRMRRIKDYIEQVDSEDDSNGSANNYDSEGEMSELILRLTNAAESLRVLHDDWDD